MIGLLKLIPPVVWIAVGGTVLAALVATGAVIYQRGQVDYRAKVGKALIQWERAQDGANRSIDTDTNRSDGELIRKLGEIERKWSASPSPLPPQQ
jgi:hypothetical protein